MYNLRLSRRARLSLGGAALTLTATAGVVTIQVTPAVAATTTHTVPAVSPTPVSTADTPIPLADPDATASGAEGIDVTAVDTAETETGGSDAASEDAKSKESTSEDAKSKSGKSKKLSKAARQRIKAAKAVAVAKKQVGDPYRWGANGPNAFDCSGLVSYSWRRAGVKIPRVTHSQYARIKKKVPFNRLKPGDLLFFSGKGHVGMYVGKGRMVHSPSSGKSVRIDKLKGWRKSSFSGAVRPGL